MNLTTGPFVNDVDFAGNAVYVDICDMTDEDMAVDFAIDHIGHDYAGHRETWPTDSGFMVVFDWH